MMLVGAVADRRRGGREMGRDDWTGRGLENPLRGEVGGSTVAETAVGMNGGASTLLLLRRGLVGGRGGGSERTSVEPRSFLRCSLDKGTFEGERGGALFGG